MKYQITWKEKEEKVQLNDMSFHNRSIVQQTSKLNQLRGLWLMDLLFGERKEAHMLDFLGLSTISSADGRTRTLRLTDCRSSSCCSCRYMVISSFNSADGLHNRHSSSPCQSSGFYQNVNNIFVHVRLLPKALVLRQISSTRRYKVARSGHKDSLFSLHRASHRCMINIQRIHHSAQSIYLERSD